MRARELGEYAVKMPKKQNAAALHGATAFRIGVNQP
ncbi:hypothetical protein N008_08650 [Hymenobacter sp. APR13]|nr:hypothetical protein N008_08650 [Hymenobacter sp. APR13]